MRDQNWKLENAGSENSRPENVGPENVGLENAGPNEQEWKIQGGKTRDQIYS